MILLIGRSSGTADAFLIMLHHGSLSVLSFERIIGYAVQYPFERLFHEGFKDVLFDSKGPLC